MEFTTQDSAQNVDIHYSVLSVSYTRTALEQCEAMHSVPLLLDLMITNAIVLLFRFRISLPYSHSLSIRAMITLDWSLSHEY